MNKPESVNASAPAADDRCRELEKRIAELTKLCHRAGDAMDAALTCPNDAGYRADAADAVEELQAV